jgi:hypothetical protein
VIDIDAPLGKPVPTGEQILDVIKPYMRIMHALHLGMIRAREKGRLGNTDADNGAMMAASDGLFEAATKEAGLWCFKRHLVFDKDRLALLISNALAAANTETMDDLPRGLAELDY